MAGIYVHIPFCRRACTYCDFHFSTNLSRTTELAEAIAREAGLRPDFFPDPQPLKTLYFGGGTPSLLTQGELELILAALKRYYTWEPDAEFTFECNPDDITEEKLAEWKSADINRLSIGVQSFLDRDLRLMGRAHDSGQAYESIRMAQAAGFDNLTVDLIYGIPALSGEEWADNVQALVELGVPHVSAYALTVEPKTALAYQVETGKVLLPEDQAFEEQYFYLIDALADAGLEHYELSNFGKPGWHSRHNSAYWSGAAYLGLGPSAHSFVGHQRSWNIAHNARYLRAVAEGNLPIEETEALTPTDQLNEFLLTRLRRTDGFGREEFRERFGMDLWEKEEKVLAEFAEKGWVQMDVDHLQLTRQGLLLSNHIISDLFQ